MKALISITVAILTLALASVFEAKATPFVFEASLNGPSESPPNASPGTGFADVIFDTVAQTMRVEVTFGGLLGTTTASHIHCCTAVPGTGVAGVATTTPTFTLFPLGVTSGTYDHTFDMTLTSSYNSSFITAHGGTVASAETALLTGMLDGDAYLNIHSTVVPGGEIRGFLQVPEPSSLVLLSSSLLALAAWRRRGNPRG